MTAPRDGGASLRLTIEQQQLLAFVTAYLRHYGCLPTATEAALACGFRSPRPAARLFHELETSGVVQRDEHYGRLGSVELGATQPALPEPDQLWLAERACVEHRALLTSLRHGLEFAPGFDAVDAIHAEGVTRSTVLRTFEDARLRLVDGGSRLAPGDHEALLHQERILDEARSLMTDWTSYCIVQLAWTMSAHQWLSEVQPLHLGYVGASFVASLRATETLLPTYWSRASNALATDPRVPELLARITELLGGVRQGIAQHFPSRPERLGVDVAALLAS